MIHCYQKTCKFKCPTFLPTEVTGTVFNAFPLLILLNQRVSSKITKCIDREIDSPNRAVDTITSSGVRWIRETNSSAALYKVSSRVKKFPAAYAFYYKGTSIKYIRRCSGLLDPLPPPFMHFTQPISNALRNMQIL